MLLRKPGTLSNGRRPVGGRTGPSLCVCAEDDENGKKMAASVGRWRRSGVCGLVLALLDLVLAVSASLNLEELSEMKYGLEILPDPVVLGQSKSEEIVMISSKYKQKYECKLPALAVKFHQDRDEDSRAYSGLGISDLLRPMETAPCLIKTKDWWTYEFCYGKHIQQYHMEESEVKGDILYLGYYQSEFDWNNETAKASKHHRLKRYHSQMYINGSKCDLNGQSRETEVRFMCEEGSGDYIARVDEPQSCSYVLTIHTTRICHHPFLRLPSTITPQSIKCHPALSPEQYIAYVKAQVSDTKRIVEEISEELKTLDTQMRDDQEIESASQKMEPPKEKHEPEEGAAEGREVASEEAQIVPEMDIVDEYLEGETDFWDKVLQPQDEDAQMLDREAWKEDPAMKAAAEQADDSQSKLRYKVIRNRDDLVKFIKELKSVEKKQKGEEASETQEDGPEASKSQETPLIEKQPQEEEVADDDEVMKEFEKELEEILLPKSEISKLKQDVKTEMEKEFDGIIDEAQEELEMEGLKGEFDRSQASKSLASTLNKLIDKLDDTETEKGEETDADARERTRGSPGPLGKQSAGKIEIKIVTTGGFGDEDDTHWLSDEDTKNLKDIFFNILVHGTEEVHREQKRQQQLEDNYRFVWDQNHEETGPAGGTDSDEMDL
ncbi:protein OS-9 isoform X2 [Rhinatrema bivittatum]|uniref:protein OS-9 isoform X2 n=1 Tax=Rhinatrema bivittatum TaxID=194408 RepID=UPI00112D5499|nr:protein OS-9 isoform X2 [Rhinatrema bivittatum]